MSLSVADPVNTEPIDPATPPPVGAAADGVPPEGATEADAAALAAQAEAAEREQRLARLMQRIDSQTDFPSLRNSIRSIQKVARSDRAHLRTLTDELQNDVALTAKLLRLINAAYYRSVGGGSITSVQRAVALMGFQTIGMLAATLSMFDRLPRGPDGERVRHSFSRALLAGLLAQALCHSGRHLEQAYLSALFQNLGQMLGWMHFPAEAHEIEAELQAAGHAGEDSASHERRERAARERLGLGFEELGLEVAQHWGWPESLQANLRRLYLDDPERVASPEEYPRVLCTAAGQLAHTLRALPDGGRPEERAAAVSACAAAFGADQSVALGLDPEAVDETVAHVVQSWRDLAQLLGLDLSTPAVPRAGTGQPARPTPLSGAIVSGGHRDAAPGRPASARPPVPAPSPAAASPAAAALQPALARALEQFSERAMADDTPLPQLVQQWLGLLQPALGLQRALLCLREPASGDLVGRLGQGERAAALVARFRVPMTPPQDLFGLLCARHADTLITDAQDPVIAQRLPAWLDVSWQARSFLVLPLVAGNQVLGLFYGDRPDPGGLHLDDAGLRLVKTLRNQLVMTLRLRGVAG